MREIYILAGQSNMSGRGLLSQAPVYGNIANVNVYTSSGVWINSPADPISDDPDSAVGPGLSFANRLSELHPGVEVGLVPCARGGSKLRAWAKDWRRDTLYGSMMARTREAAQTGVIKGLIWWQGESDAGCFSDPPYTPWPENLSWPSDFARFITDIRADLGMPYLAVAFAQLSAEPSGIWDYAGWGGMQMRQSQIQAPQLAMIQTSDLPLFQANDVHLSTAGYVTAGIRFADAIHSIM